MSAALDALTAKRRYPHHSDEQHQAWLAVEATLDACTAATIALRDCGEGTDAEYARLLAEANRADREFAGAWDHYHSI